MKNIFFSHREISTLLKKQLVQIKRYGQKKYQVLDMGCGDGVTIYDLDSNNLIGKNINYIGVDMSKTNVINASLLNPHRKFIKGDALNLPFGRNSFDFIWSLMVMEHVADVNKFVCEIKRVLKVGGTCYVSSILKRKNAVYFYRNNGSFVLDPTHVHEFKTAEEFKNLFKKNGFKIVDFKITQRKYSFFELILKLCVKFGIIKESVDTRLLFWKNNFLKKVQWILKLPVPGFYQIEILCSKK